MAAILISTFLNLAILDSAILVFPFKLTNTCQDWFPPFPQKYFTHSFWLNLMMAAILNPDILNLDMLDSAILVFHLKVTHTCQDWFSPFAQKKPHSFSLTQLDNGSQIKLCHVRFIHFAKKKNFNLSFSLNLMMVAILNLAILDSAIFIFPFEVTHTCQDWFPPFPQKNFTHSFWLNLMMAAILTSTMLDSDTLLSSLRLTQKHSHSTLTLTHSNSIWFKLIYSHSTWWWQPSWIWPSRIQPS